MIEKLLHTLGGIERYGIASMGIFILVFTGVLIWAFLQKKSHLDYMARVALDPEPERGCLSRSGTGAQPTSEPSGSETTLVAAAAETAALRPAPRPSASSTSLL